ncbi:unnamed protein product, partial [Gongylonema pulchrum]|uniref:Elongation of very long chain fatty acids protein n=1 Tax=Gongylonema pulchrum TaxID=637853 RepID=A0A183EM59_9BILA
MEQFNYFRYALPFERVENPIEKTLLFQRNWHQSITVSVGYFILIKVIQRLMERRAAFKLRWPLFLWNLSLALFSICGFIRFSEDLIYSLLYKGAYQSFCYSVHPNDVAAYWACLFFFSKIVELGDTLFIVLKKKPLIFLHYYHHAAVLIYAAHSGLQYYFGFLFLLFLNFLEELIV